MNCSSIETPCYIVDEREYELNLRGFRDALGSRWKSLIMGYSVKTNPLSWMVLKAKHEGYFAEVVSDYEYEHAIKLGFNKNEIIFNGPIKGYECFCDALKGGAYVNVDSWREIGWLEAEMPSEGPLRVGLRVNINLDMLVPGESRTGSSGSRFGFCVENGDFARAVARLRRLPGVEIAGLHLHVNSLTRQPKVFSALVSYAGQLVEQNQLQVSYVDLGGGFFGGYPNLSAYEEYAEEISGEMGRFFSPEKTTLIVEPGGAIQATPVSFHAKVLDVKEVRGERIVVTQASRVWLDPTMSKSSHRLRFDFPKGRCRVRRQLICGFTCMDTDRLMLLENQPELEVGDCLTFDMVGAYTYCFNPAFFIEVRPRFYRQGKDGYVLLEDRNRLEDIRGCEYE